MILPHLVFFDPKPKAIDLIVKLAKGKQVIDCGCGVGRLVKMIEDKGVPALGIDLHERDGKETPSIILQDVTRFEFKKSHLVVITRPSRGDWIKDTIRLANKAGADILYIGLESHVEEDLSEFKFTKIMEECGRDDEQMWVMKSTEKNEMTKFFLIEWFINGNGSCPPLKLGPSWFEEEDGKWINFCGGCMFKKESDNIVSTVEAESFDELDWFVTSLSQPNSKAGWLDRDGKFYGCRSTEHDIFADKALKKTVGELEKSGWVRIYGENSWIIEYGRLSADQKNWLSEHGHNVMDSD